MKNPSKDDFGVVFKYDVGDKVRVWRVYKSPVGTIDSIVDENAHPIVYVVRYIYEDNRLEYVEKFESQDLTLVERKYGSYRCNCKTGSGNHASWCNLGSKHGY